VIVEDGRDVGRIYEDKHSRPELRWFWSITIYVIPKLGITTSGRAASLEEAKAQFLASWHKCPTDSSDHVFLLFSVANSFARGLWEDLWDQIGIVI
jgi:hypothetical protein